MYPKSVPVQVLKTVTRFWRAAAPVCMMQVDTDAAKEFVSQVNIPFLETSAKNATNVEVRQEEEHVSRERLSRSRRS